MGRISSNFEIFSFIEDDKLLLKMKSSMRHIAVEFDLSLDKRPLPVNKMVFIGDTMKN